MAYDESLLERVRALVGTQPGYVEKKMFSGVAVMLNGNMAVGAVRDGLLVRTGPNTDELLAEPGVHPFEMGSTRGPSKGWLVVEPDTYADDDVLESWVGIGVAYARTLPPKMSSDALPERARAVAAALAEAGATGEVRELPDSARTAAAAAKALGCDVGAIANSLVFMADGRPLLVMTSGRHRVDVALLAERLGRAAVERATPEQVRAATGQAIGGVAPLGHPAPIETVVDSSLAGFDPLWAAAGHPHTVFPTSYAELLAITGGRAVAVD